MLINGSYPITLLNTSLWLLIISLFFFNLLLTLSPMKLLQFWGWKHTLRDFKPLILLTSIFLCVNLILIFFACQTPQPAPYIMLPIYLVFKIFININELSIIFLLLVSFLFPIIFILSDFDFSPRVYKYFTSLVGVYTITYALLFCSDLFMFYIFYEFLVFMVFFTISLSSNARGCLEASLFFLGWAILGSLFVAAAVAYLIYNFNFSTLLSIRLLPLTTDETFLLYIFSFVGFGTKLALWPVWYWLPRAHVEVSTAMSVFLSCVLIKICLYCLLRFWWLINNEPPLVPLTFLVICCVFDITARLITQTDLKAIIAYGSVLHVNLLVLLVLLDTNILSLGSILYIWGHSLAAAGLFFAANLIERCFGSRLTSEVSGLYQMNPLVGIITIFAIIGFLDFPPTIFFWGELWLWTTLFSLLPLPACLLMFVSAIIYLIIFFRLWWGMLFSAGSRLSVYPTTTLTRVDLFLVLPILASQFFFGLQPTTLNLVATY